MHALDILGDPVRRRLLELLADGEAPAGALTGVIREEFGISQPAVSQHLRVLREAGFAEVRADANRRWYSLRPEPLREVDVWLQRYRRFWDQRIDALETELVRGRRAAALDDAAADRPARPTPTPTPTPTPSHEEPT